MIDWNAWKVDVPDGCSGEWQVNRAFARLPLLDGTLVEGDFTTLTRGKVLVMRDDPQEVMDHLPFLDAASGDVLIVGLGLGVILRKALDKPGVRSVTVIEKSPDVIRLVAPSYPDPRVEILCCDVFDFVAIRKWDAGWIDIHDAKEAKNAPDLEVLKAYFKPLCRWLGAWGLPG